MLGTAGMLSTRMTAYRPARTAICGNIVIARIRYSDGVLPRKRILPSAYPANDPTVRLRTVTDTDTRVLFQSARRKVGLLSTARKFCRVGSTGHRVAGVWISSRCVLSAETSAQ